MELSLEEVIDQQKDIAEWISRSWTNAKKLGKPKMTVQALEVRLKKLEENWNLYVQNHHLIKRFPESKKSDYIQKALFDITEESYYNECAEYNAYLDSLNSKNTISLSGQQQQNVGQQVNQPIQFHLPKFTIPDFSGDVLEWESFRDQFQGILDRTPNLSNVHKLLLLQQHLKGDAEEMLKNTPLIEASFEGAWADLEKRYGNKRLLLTHHMNSLLDLPVMSKLNSHEIKRVLDFFKQTVRSFESLEISKVHWNHWLVLLLTKKLDDQLRIKWETSLSEVNDFPSFDELCTFLENYSRALESIDPIKSGGNSGTSKSNQSNQTSAKSQIKQHSHASTSQPSKNKGKVKTNYFCPLCNNNEHSLGFCLKFKALQGVDRYHQAKKLRLCYNCLKNHYPSPCPSKFTCKTCSQKHNSLLHGCFPQAQNYDANKNSVVNPITSTSISINPVATNSSCLPENISVTNSDIKTSNVSATWSTNKVVLLATAKVSVCSHAGKSVVLRALIDTGSDTSIISEWAVQSLGLHRKVANTIIFGVQGKTGLAKYVVEFIVKPHNSSSFSIDISAFVLEKLTSFIPSKTFLCHSWPHIENLELADPEFFKSSHIAVDLILGADVCGLFFSGKTIPGPLGIPSAHETPFGYILMGPTSIQSTSDVKMSCVITSKVDDHENSLFDLRKF